MSLRPPRSTRPDTRCPYTTLFRSVINLGRSEIRIRIRLAGRGLQRQRTLCVGVKQQGRHLVAVEVITLFYGPGGRDAIILRPLHTEAEGLIRRKWRGLRPNHSGRQENGDHKRHSEDEAAQRWTSRVTSLPTGFRTSAREIGRAHV